MQISLIPHWEKFIQEKLDDGRYENASEVFREALRLLEKRDQEYEVRLNSLRNDIEDGRRGQANPFNDEEESTSEKEVRIMFSISPAAKADLY